MEADEIFLIFYWMLCFAIDAMLWLFVSVGVPSIFVAGLVFGFAFAMTITFVQDRLEARRYHYGYKN